LREKLNAFATWWLLLSWPWDNDCCQCVFEGKVLTVQGVETTMACRFGPGGDKRADVQISALSYHMLAVPWLHAYRQKKDRKDHVQNNRIVYRHRICPCMGDQCTLLQGDQALQAYAKSWLKLEAAGLVSGSSSLALKQFLTLDVDEVEELKMHVGQCFAPCHWWCHDEGEKKGGQNAMYKFKEVVRNTITTIRYRTSTNFDFDSDDESEGDIEWLRKEKSPVTKRQKDKALNA
jgi:hypothetical protein